MADLPHTASALGWEGDLVEELEVSGHIVDVVARFNHSELARRGFGDPVLDRAALRALMSLPLGIVVPFERVAPEDRLAINLADPHLVDRTPRGLCRLFEPACELVGILKSSQRLRDAVDTVAMFSAFSLRAVTGTTQQCRRTLQAYAATYGVGVVASDGEEASVLVRPQRRGVRPSAARWRFCEQIYDRRRAELRAAAMPVGTPGD